MKLATPTAAALLLSTMAFAMPASAMPIYGGVAATEGSSTLVKYGHGPLPYGLYGHKKKKHHGVSNGTGYHGRGTRTGGPAGGLPGRS